MKQTLFRLHQPNCPAKHKGNNYEADEQRKWQPCNCAIYLYGKLLATDTKPTRRSTGARDWETAKAIVKGWAQAGAATPGRTSPLPQTTATMLRPAANLPTSLPTSDTDAPTIEVAAQAYLKAHEDKASAKHTIKIKTLMLGKLKNFSKLKGYTHVQQWKLEDVREFLAAWKCSSGTMPKNWSQVKAFFEFCRTQGYITDNPARYKEINNRATKEATGDNQKSPYSKEEIDLMIKVARERYGRSTIKWDRKKGNKAPAGSEVSYRYSWTGEDLVDFILLAIFTGLRISDLATFHIDRIAPDGSVHFRALKNGTFVDTWIPEWLHDKMKARVAKSGPYIFGYVPKPDEDMDVVTDLPRRKLKRLWGLCGKWEEKPTPHRFRHTFVRILLENGTSVKRIASLTGDTEEVIRQYYSKWIPQEQEQIRTELKTAFAKMPNFIEPPRKQA
jgi:integrase